jgi:uncharacterized protein YjeT (DUF2065 family)
MSGISLTLLVLGTLLILEGLFIIIYPKTTKKIVSKMFKNPDKTRQVGTIEFIIGLALILIGSLL